MKNGTDLPHCAVRSWNKLLLRPNLCLVEVRAVPEDLHARNREVGRGILDLSTCCPLACSLMGLHPGAARNNAQFGAI